VANCSLSSLHSLDSDCKDALYSIISNSWSRASLPNLALEAGLAAVVEPKIPPVAGVVAVCCSKPPVVVVEPERLKPEPNGFAAPSGDCVVACVLPKIDVVAAAG